MNKLLLICGLFLVSAFSEPASRAETGITDSEILFGESIALTGVSSARAKEMKAGSDLYFTEINQQGGVFGRKIRVLAYDDGYDPKKALDNTKRLIETDKVFGLFQMFGTPTIKAVLPIVRTSQIPVISPTSPAEFLRRPVVENIFPVKPGSLEEGTSMVDFLVGNKGLKKVCLFYQDDAFGTEGKQATETAFEKYGLHRHCEGVHQRNSTDMSAAIETIAKAKPDAVILWTLTEPATAFVKAAAAKGLKPVIIAHSVVNDPSFIAGVRDSGMEIYFDESFPLESQPDSKLVMEYTQKATAAGLKPNSGGFEGYVNAAVLSAALQKAGKDLTRKSLKTALENPTGFDLGGLTVRYKPDNHQGLTRVYVRKLGPVVAAEPR